MSEDYYKHEDVVSLFLPDWFSMMMKGAWMEGLEPMQPIKSEFNYYHPYACHSCKRGSFQGRNTILSRCSKCRIVLYCCREHQAHDWSNHKILCKALRKATANEPRTMASIADWREFEVVTLLQVRKYVDAQLIPTFCQMAFLQPRCRRCFRTPAKHSIKLIVCLRCSGAAVCSECWENNNIGSTTTGQDIQQHVELFHPRTGKPGGLAECDCHLISLCCMGMIVEQRSPMVVVSRTNRTRRFQPCDWRDYFNSKESDMKFPAEYIRMAPVTAFVTDALSMPMTVQHVISRPQVEITDYRRLVIHMVGASWAEFQSSRSWIELARNIPELEYLKVVMIGPDLTMGKGMGYPMRMDEHGEPSMRPNFRGELYIVCDLYHNVLSQLVANDERPTLIFLPRPGLYDAHFAPYWAPTIDCMLEMDVPFCVTGHSQQDTENDVVMLTSRCGSDHPVAILIPPTPNPFRGLRPFHDPQRQPADFFYSNASFAVARRRRRLT